MLDSRTMHSTTYDADGVPRCNKMQSLKRGCLPPASERLRQTSSKLFIKAFSSERLIGGAWRGRRQERATSLYSSLPPITGARSTLLLLELFMLLLMLFVGGQELSSVSQNARLFSIREGNNEGRVPEAAHGRICRG